MTNNTTKKETTAADKAWAETTEAGKIWAEIEGRAIAMFSLPAQKVSAYCQPVQIDKNRCFLVHSAAAVVPALEEALGKDYTVEIADKYVIVSRTVKSF